MPPYAIIIPSVIVIILFFAGLRIVPQAHTFVVERLGKFAYPLERNVLVHRAVDHDEIALTLF